jgi:RNA polymerase sigma-70 factor (ECF subfamily)
MPDPAVVNKYPILPEYQNLAENEIIARCQSGDLEAFNALISRYENRVLNLTRRYLRDYQAAVDEAQEVFIRVFRKIKSFRGDSSFGTWLYRVTSNHCLNVLEQQKRQQENSGPLLSLDFSMEGGTYHEVLSDPKAVAPDAAFQNNELQSRIIRAMDRLPADQRQALVLFHYENMKYEQIAEIMELSISTVCSAIYRGRQHLKKILEKENSGHG